MLTKPLVLLYSMYELRNQQATAKKADVVLKQQSEKSS
jgi:hypothetical protein